MGAEAFVGSAVLVVGQGSAALAESMPLPLPQAPCD